MEFLKKQTRAHKYRSKLSNDEIARILSRHVPRLKSIQVYKLAPKDARRFPEIYDEYLERENTVIERARVDLQKEFRKKIKYPIGAACAIALDIYLLNV